MITKQVRTKAIIVSMLTLMGISYTSLSNIPQVHAEVTTSAKENVQNIREVALNKKLNLKQNVIIFDGTEADFTEAKNMVNRIKKINPVLLETMAKNGTLIKLTNKKMTDTPEYQWLKGVIPRGWEGITNADGEQMTWDDVPGLGSTPGKPVVVRIGYSATGMGHSAINLELHEIGHAIDRAALNNFSHSKEFTDIQKLEQESFLGGQYFSNPEEYFAEAFAYYYLNNDTKNELATKAPATYKIIKETIKKTAALNSKSV
ncbi:anthrax toxin lethal factor-related metalloendopeptidase [Bacillus cereus group sp. BfR-BA-01380]|uniref:anthrax toxin lethal factor-related metalloendopeptidase n=1 Tax=Bacillus cereus group sp. BfR-BA-01380 TaxID=2920324 RepID=UPI001F57FC65|nr:hypothetical protein [Bacillus cereus group sp. BfR-BA-01380]